MGVLKQSVLVTLGGVLLFAWAGCVNEEEGSLYDPSAQDGPAPSLVSITPSDSAQAAVDFLTIAGTNFSTVNSNNVVFFTSVSATKQGVPVQSSPTLLVVKAPFLTDTGTTQVRVGVIGSSLLSNGLTYRLWEAVVPYGLLGQDDVANALIVDGSENIYVSVSVGGTGVGVKRILPDGSVTDYASDTTGITSWSNLKFGPGGYLYAARGVRAIYRFQPGGGPPAVVWRAFPSGVTITTLDFDQNQVLWAAGSNTSNINNAAVYSVTQTPTTNSTVFAATVRSIRVFNNNVYMSAFKDSVWKIWRAPILGDTIGTPQVYFDFNAAYGALNYIPSGLTFSSDGTLYIATNAPAGIVVVSPSGQASTPYSAYSGLFGTGIRYLAWGSGQSLYAVTEGGKLLKVNARAAGAPYF